MTYKATAIYFVAMRQPVPDTSSDLHEIEIAAWTSYDSNPAASSKSSEAWYYVWMLEPV